MLSARVLLPSLITAASALFILGVSVERGQSDRHAREPAEQVGETREAHNAETASEGEQAHADASARRSGHDSDEEEPRILGIDPESTPLVVLAAIGSLLLGAAVLRWPRARALLAILALAMLAFAVLDIREVTHQLDEERGGVAVMAGVVATLHLAAASLAAAQTGRRRKRSPAPAT
jgi:hypothetical protein